MLPTEFYLVPEELYRLGSDVNPKLSYVRVRDVDVVKLGDVDTVIANGKGVSVFDKVGILQSPMVGWVWCIPRRTSLPYGLKLINDKPHHYCLAPVRNMSVQIYKDLLDDLAHNGTRVYKKYSKAI